jgi:hypothetical protein
VISPVLRGSPAEVLWVGQCRRCLSVTAEQPTPLGAHDAAVLCCAPVPLALTAAARLLLGDAHPLAAIR